MTHYQWSRSAIYVPWSQPWATFFPNGSTLGVTCSSTTGKTDIQIVRCRYAAQLSLTVELPAAGPFVLPDWWWTNVNPQFAAMAGPNAVAAPDPDLSTGFDDHQHYMASAALTGGPPTFSIDSDGYPRRQDVTWSCSGDAESFRKVDSGNLEAWAWLGVSRFSYPAILDSGSVMINGYWTGFLDVLYKSPTPF